VTRPAFGFKPVRAADWHFDSKGSGRYPEFRWDGQPKRCPRKGEYYLSGAIPAAYCAKNDLTSEYFICVPVNQEPKP
jgi:hypothetical protein